jgi:hypothetical protein
VQDYSTCKQPWLRTDLLEDEKSSKRLIKAFCKVFEKSVEGLSSDLFHESFHLFCLPDSDFGRHIYDGSC